MSYENPNRITYIFALFDYGAAGGGRVDLIAGPKGKAADLYDYGVQNIDENFAGTTTSAMIAIGNSGDPDAYGNELSLNGGTTTTGGRTLRSLYDPIAQKSSFDALLVDRTIPKDTVVYLTSTDATGSPTGQACPYVVLDWAA